MGEYQWNVLFSWFLFTFSIQNIQKKRPLTQWRFFQYFIVVSEDNSDKNETKNRT